MAITFQEIPGGDMAFRDPIEVRRFRATNVPQGSFDAFEYVADYALQNTAKTIVTSVGTLNRQDIQIHENVYARSYEITVPYGIQQRQSGAYQITVDQTGGMVNVKAGRRITGYQLAAGDMVDNGGLIGVEGDDVKGIEIPVEQTKIVVMFRHPQGILSKAYIDRVGHIVGYPNSDSFLGYAAGEVLFKGGNFSQTNCEATATYNFDISFNRSGMTIGGITGVAKFGWDVMSFNYRDDTFDNGTKIVSIQKLTCIEIIRPAAREWVSYQTAFGWGA